MFGKHLTPIVRYDNITDNAGWADCAFTVDWLRSPVEATAGQRKSALIRAGNGRDEDAFVIILFSAFAIGEHK